MRLDLFLKTSRLIVRRSLAQQFCDAGSVKVNGAKAKSSKEIKAADEIEIRRGKRITTIKVLDIPKSKQVSKTASQDLFEVVSENFLEDEIFST